MDNPHSHPRLCKYCETELHGRKDQVFCSTACRNAWHNEERSQREKVIRDTNRILRKNWKILVGLNSKGKTKVTRMQLLAHDFDFRHFTSVFTTRDDKVYKYCYDQGYLYLGDDHFLLVRSNSGSS